MNEPKEMTPIQPTEPEFNLDDETPLACPLRTGPDDEPCEACQ